MYFMKVMKNENYECIQVAKMLRRMGEEAKKGSLLEQGIAVDITTLDLAVGKHCHSIAQLPFKCHVPKNVQSVMDVYTIIAIEYAKLYEMCAVIIKSEKLSLF